MDNAALVQQVVQAVLARLQEAKKPIIALLSEENEAIAEEVRASVGQDYTFVFTMQADMPCDAQRYIVPLLTCSDMAALVSGMATSPCGEAVLQLILAGKSVEVLAFEYHQYKDTLPVALHKLYAGYERTLASFGVRQLPPPVKKQVRFCEGLLTATAVREAIASGVQQLRVSSGVVITPLARDEARLGNLVIAKEV